MRLKQKFFLMRKEILFMCNTHHTMNEYMNDEKNDAVLKHY